MKRHRILFALCLELVVAPARAQLVDDGGTSTLNGVTTNLSGSLIVGTNGSGTLLVLTNGARVLGNGGGIGQDTNAAGNLVLLTGSGTLWASTNNLYVGSNGFGNRLVISDGARATNVVGYIGYNASGSNNTALVTGAGSVWSNFSNLRVGQSGRNSQLVVSNGGRVTAEGLGYVGFNTSSSNNQVLVTDAGSSLRIELTMTLGNNGSWNRLVISNGGFLFGNSFVDLGYASVSSNNEAIITGAGSIWSNITALHVGDAGSGNRLTITNGGQVRNKDNADIGFTSSGRSNKVLVTDAGSLMTNFGTLYVGNGGSANQMTITNGGWVVDYAGRLGTGATSSNNEAVVTGIGSAWSNRTDLSVGHGGSGNRLTITEGGTVVAVNNAYIGLNITTSSNNLLLVAGGTLRSKNASGTGTLDIRGGTNRLDAGLIDVDALVMTNAAGRFEFNGGTMNVRTAKVANGQSLVVGEGVNAALLNIIVNAMSTFADGLAVSSNATLSANGTILGNVTNGGTLVAGSSPGSLVLANDLRLRPGATTAFRLGGPVAGSQFDVITVSNAVEFGGALTLWLTNGYRPVWSNRFTLLTCASSIGAFANVPSGGRLAVAGGTNGNGSFRVDYNNGSLRLSDYRLDNDGDGIDDGWAIAHFGHSPLNSIEQSSDGDGDGRSNLAEYLAGTHPKDTLDVLKVTSSAAGEGGPFVLQFAGVADKTYQIEYTDNLGAFWSVVAAPELTAPSPGVCQFVDDGSRTGGLPSTGKRFYRVRLVP